MTGLVTEDGLVTDDPTAAGTATGRIRFSLLDELTCCYDRAAEPANVHLEVRLPVRLDQASFRAAVLAALAAHPSFMARRVAAGPWRRSSYWESPQVPDCDPVTTASWADESELACLRAAFLSDSPPLDHSPALRFLLACGPDSDCVILNAHHAVVDGLSCLSLLRAVAGQYGGQG